MKKSLIFVFIISLCSLYSYTQVIISDKEGVDIHPSAVLEINSDDKGFLLPRLTTEQRDAISNPSMSLMIYNTDNQCVDIFVGGQWNDFWCVPSPEIFEECGDNFTFLYNGQKVVYGTVEGENETCWLDRNLGAERVAESYEDENSYGDLFQWGRAADGHHKRDSNTHSFQLNGVATTHLPDTGEDWDGKFIYRGDNVNPLLPRFDWLETQNDNLWQGVDGVNNPCPEGWRIPTADEFQDEIDTWDYDSGDPSNPDNPREAAFESPLKIPAAGRRAYTTAGLFSEGSFGYYWAQNVDGTDAETLYFTGNALRTDTYGRAGGLSVRCILDVE